MTLLAGCVGNETRVPNVETTAEVAAVCPVLSGLDVNASLSATWGNEMRVPNVETTAEVAAVCPVLSGLAVKTSL